MKTIKSGLKKAAAIPKEVRAAEQARAKAKKAFDRFIELSNNPIIKQHVETLIEKKPALTEEQTRQKEIIMLCGMFFEYHAKIENYMLILSGISELPEDNDIGILRDMLSQIRGWHWTLHAIGGRALQLLGVIKDSDIEEELKSNDAFYVFREELTRGAGKETPWFDKIKQGIRLAEDKE